MKKALSLLLALVLCLSLVACGSDGTTETKDNEATNTTTESQEATTEATEPELDILGEWVSVKDNSYTLTFQDDGTCFYTGTPPTNTATGSFVIDATITWNGTVSGTETTTPPETTAPKEKVNTYKYTFDPNVSIITIYTSTTTNYEVVIENGKVVIATVDGECAFVRAEDYEEYHAAYLAHEEAKKQEQIENFYAEGKAGRTELEVGTAYAIQDGLNMTVTDCVLAENANPLYQGSSNFQSLYLKITLENASDEGIYIRQDGIWEGNIFHYEWGSDVRANVEVKYFGGFSIGIIGGSTDASDYVFKYEELGKTKAIGAGNHIHLDPGEQSEYYFSISNVSIEQAKQSPVYAIITFDNYEFFCDLSALVQNFV